MKTTSCPHCQSTDTYSRHDPPREKGEWKCNRCGNVWNTDPVSCETKLAHAERELELAHAELDLHAVPRTWGPNPDYKPGVAARIARFVASFGPQRWAPKKAYDPLTAEARAIARAHCHACRDTLGGVCERHR